MPKAKPRSRKTRSELRENNQQGVQLLHQQVLQRRACQSPPDIQQPVQPPVSQPLVHQPTSVNFQPPVIVQQPAVQPFLVDVQQPVQHQLLNVQPPMHQHEQPQHEQPQSVERRQLSDGPLQVYIVGSSIIKYAEQHAKNTVGQHLGLNRYKIFLNWKGVSSLKVENALSAIEELVQHNSPDIIVIHCGGNNVGSTPLGQLMFSLRSLLNELFQKYSFALIVFSQILPRLKWRYERNHNSLELARKRINNSISTKIVEKGGALIKYPEIVEESQALFRRDQVHLSSLGNDIFLHTLQGALYKFCHNNDVVSFPDVSEVGPWLAM